MRRTNTSVETALPARASCRVEHEQQGRSQAHDTLELHDVV